MAYYALSDIANGVTALSSSSAWTFGAYTMLANNTSTPISVYALQFVATNIPSADATQEILFEIALGATGSEQAFLQLPYSIRSDTAVGYYMTHVLNAFLPEPVLIQPGRRISVRVTDSLTSTNTYSGIKLLYNATAPIVNGSLPNNYQFVRVGDGMSASERIR